MRRASWLLALAVAAAAGVLLAWPQPSPGPDGGDSPVAVALASTYAAGGAGARFPCATCHYAFLEGFDTRAIREQGGPGRVWYNLTLQPVSGYELAIAWAAPRAAGDGLDEPLARETAVPVPAGGGVVRVAFDLPWPAAALVAEVRPGDQDSRPPLTLLLEGPAPAAAQDLGSTANKHAWALPAAPGAPLTGRWAAVVTASDPRDGLRLLNVTFRAVPQGYEVRVDDGSATGTRGRAHAFAWQLPAAGLPGAPERLHVGAVAYNAHPVGNWSLPPEGDRAVYEGNVSVALPAAPPWGPFTDADVARAWEGRDAVLLHEHAFDGILARRLNDRGERTGETLRTDLADCPPCDPPVFPPMPPGTTLVRATLDWAKRDPLSPDPVWRLAVTQRPEPDFRYPEPVERTLGHLAWDIPVQAVEWEPEGAEGWLQTWPLLAPDADGTSLFSGRYAFRVEAVRGPR